MLVRRYTYGIGFSVQSGAYTFLSRLVPTTHSTTSVKPSVNDMTTENYSHHPAAQSLLNPEGFRAFQFV